MYDHRPEVEALLKQAAQFRQEAKQIVLQAAVRAADREARARELERQAEHVDRLCSRGAWGVPGVTPGF